MAASIHRAPYYYLTVKDSPGAAYELLSRLASSGVKLLAFSGVPTGVGASQLVLFPEKEERLVRAAEESALDLSGPEHALLIRGDDKLATLVEVHRQLSDAGINVASSSGVAADCGRFGYLLYVRSSDFERAAQLLDL